MYTNPPRLVAGGFSFGILCVTRIALFHPTLYTTKLARNSVAAQNFSRSSFLSADSSVTSHFCVQSMTLWSCSASLSRLLLAFFAGVSLIW